MEDILKYIYPQDILFSNSENGLLMACWEGREAQRVSVLRMFPLEYKEEYLCVRKKNYSRIDEETEIGIIKNLKDFPENQAELIRKELERRYFMPEIISVTEVREELSNTFWKVQTDKGESEFTLTDMSTNVHNLGNNSVMLTDVFGNRYCIPDITKLEGKAKAVLEIWV